MSRMTYDDLQNILRRNKSITAEGLIVAARNRPCQPERVPDQALEVVQRPQEGVGQRITVRITCYRVRLQDPDNGLFKPLVDQLRYAAIISEDNHSTIKLETDQVRVKTKKEEGTKVEVIYP